MRSQCYFFKNNENFTIVKITIIGKQLRVNFQRKKKQLQCAFVLINKNSDFFVFLIKH